MNTFPPVNEQMDLIRRGTEEIILEEDLEERLDESQKSGTPLVVKLGCDPSQPDLHLGHSVVLRKLNHFQELGHRAVLVIGDFTAMIGDPSGRNKTRPQISAEKTEKHGQTYVDQASAILDVERVEIVHNSAWLGKMDFGEVIQLASRYTVARMLERDDFEKRYSSGTPISIHEFLYPLAQAMDSVQLKADVELGGTDQKFNLLVARDLQRDYDQKPQVVVTTPLLEGTDGVQKMSKSYGNYIGVREDAREMYGKAMSIPDEHILHYFELTTDVPRTELDSFRERLEDESQNPRDLKKRLAREIVTLYHSKKKAAEAEDHFERIFVRKEVPEEMDRFETGVTPINIVQLLYQAGLVESKGEGRRLVKQGAVQLDGEKITEITADVELDVERILKVGKRRFLRVSA